MPTEVMIVSIVMGACAFTGTVWAWVYFNLGKRELELKSGDTQLGPVVDALRDDLDETRGQLAETQERLDFAERMLAAGRAQQEHRSD